MTKRPHIRNTILIYFYVTLFLVFLLLAGSFNWATRRQVVQNLKAQPSSAEELVSTVAGSSKGSAGGRHQQLRDMMHSTEDEGKVNLLFLNENYEMTLPLVNQSDESRHGGSRGMMHGTLSSPTGAEAEADILVVGHAVYLERMTVLDYMKTSGFNLTDSAVTPGSINGQQYFLQSIPFVSSEGEQDEFVVAFVGTAQYDRQLAETMEMLIIVMIPILILTFFIVRFLAGRLARPISRLEGLSSRLGAGGFRGENLALREQELVDLNHSLNETARRLKEYDDNQKVFFQNVSHELRTPLTNIRGYTEGMKVGVFDRETGSQVIMDESVRLEKLVDNILYLSRLESGQSVEENLTFVSLSDLL